MTAALTTEQLPRRHHSALPKQVKRSTRLPGRRSGGKEVKGRLCRAYGDKGTICQDASWPGLFRVPFVEYNEVREGRPRDLSFVLKRIINITKERESEGRDVSYSFLGGKGRADDHGFM